MEERPSISIAPATTRRRSAAARGRVAACCALLIAVSPSIPRGPEPARAATTASAATSLDRFDADYADSLSAARAALPSAADAPAAPVADAALAADEGTRPSLLPTEHPPLPKSLEELWLVPAAQASASAAAPASAALKRFADALGDIADEDYAAALPKVSDPRLARTPVADYAAYYTALSELHTGRADRARAGFNALNARRPSGILREWALTGEAEAAEAQQQFGDAARLYEMASMLKVAAPDQILDGLARSYAAAGDRARALTAYRRVYYEFPLSELSDNARDNMLQLAGIDEATRLRQDLAFELGRAQRLFGAKRYAEALAAFEALRDLAQDDDRELVGLRIAEAHFYLGRYRQALDAARPYTSRASRKAEARFFSLSALRGTGDHDAYVAEARRLVEDVPTSPWAEETLNNLATHYILVDEDDAAVDVFADYLAHFPTGRYAQRAAWKLGWARYRQQRYQETIAVFEQAAAAFPRSDYRPPYLYWSARAYDQLSQQEPAASRYSLIAVDYLNSYYGRLADEHLRKRGITAAAQRRALAEKPAAVAATTSADRPASSVARATLAQATSVQTAAAQPMQPGTTSTTSTGTPSTGAATAGTPAAAAPGASAAAATEPAPTGASDIVATDPRASAAATNVPVPSEHAARIRQLIAAGLYAPALAEVDYARRQWGPSPSLEATLAWLYRAQGDLRRGINTMKRAYPQYLTADGQRLPRDAQRVIFPLDYWPLIRRHSVARGLDPYLIAALVAQESTFVADIRSSANAYGLMQVLPTTGRQLSRALGIRRFTTARLTDPETNVRLGTLYFQRLVKQFGGTHYALASYNAGESRVERWIAERPPLPQDEFIDDIPFPETQNYVKRILGTAEDYRRLYGD